MIFNKTGSKLIAAVLTAALALSPVFVSPISANDGQDVETQASSWRYQDGDIIIDEGLDPEDSDLSASALEAEKPEEELLEDYNAQMGSSMTDAKAAEAAEEPSSEETAVESDEEPAAEQTEETTAEAPAGEAVEEPAAEAAAEPAEEPIAEAAEPEGVLTAQGEAKAEVPAAEAAEPQVSAQSATILDRYWSWNSGKIIRGPGYLKGIDVSYWQGSIDWAKVKAAGVDFAILRCGYGSNTSSKDDSTFAANVRGCVANGIPYGVYLYSYASTVAMANDEADHALRLLRANNCNLQYPVYYDLEDTKVAKASNATIVSMANTFCNKLSSNGYASGVYANLTWWNNKLAAFDGYDRWVAQWSDRCTYGKDYSIWQCTSEAGVDGISGRTSSRVDANLLMVTRDRMDTYMKYGCIRYSITTIAGKKYIVSNLGDMVKNRFFGIWPYIYAVDANGVLQANTKYWIGSIAYILDGQGRAYINKSKTKKKKVPYYRNPGSGKVGKIKKKGTSFYVLRTSGKWSQMANGYWIQTSKTKKTEIYPEYRPNVNVTYTAKLKKKTASRSGPSNGYIKKKTFKKNKKVTVIGTYGGWAKLSSGQWLPLSRLK